MSRQDLPRRPPSAAGDLAAIVAEFKTEGVGPLMLSEVRQVAYQVAPKYNAAIYSEIGNWRHGFDDLVQDVVSESLLAERQAKYLIDTALRRHPADSTSRAVKARSSADGLHDGGSQIRHPADSRCAALRVQDQRAGPGLPTYVATSASWRP